MIILENFHPILKSIVENKINNQETKNEHIDVSFADFDKIFYQVVADDDKSNLKVKVRVPFFHQISSFNVKSHLQEVYGKLVEFPANGAFDIILNLPFTCEPTQKDQMISTVPSLRRMLYHGLLNNFVTNYKNKNNNQIVQFCYDDQNYMYIKANADHIMVFFSISFQNDDDIIFGKIFVQEFNQSKKSTPNAPSISTFFKEPPTELTSLKINSGPNVAFIGIALQPRHFEGLQKDKTFDMLSIFPSYIDYSIKCTKNVIQSKMKNKTEDFVKQLNKAKPELNKPVEKKTFTGKTFGK